MINKAKKIAEKVHKNQRDLKNYPYMSHILDVAERVSHLGDKYQIVALLHDAIEDAKPDIFKQEITQEILNSFDKEIVEAILAMSKGSGEDYFKDYLPRLKTNEIACQVKIADSSHNLSKAHLIEEMPLQAKLRNKYIRVLNTLGVEGKSQEKPLEYKEGKWKKV